jgi:hypothetical protein
MKFRYHDLIKTKTSLCETDLKFRYHDLIQKIKQQQH